MKTKHGQSSHIVCPECDIGPFKRNHYFTGKLLVERDFTDEQRYFIDKLRHHHQRLHGNGVVCGLQVTEHESEACQNRYVYIEPGSAIDCCGREILVVERECIDITSFEAVQELYKAADAVNGDTESYTLQICIRYKQCPTEAIPVLYDECGCDETRCAPNRILESWELNVLVVPTEAEESETEGDEDCCEQLWDSLEGCPSRDTGDCIVLATIEGYRPRFRFEDMPNGSVNADTDAKAQIARIDNRQGRHLLPSTQMLADMVKCLCEREPSSNGGEPASGIDRVEATFVACTEPGAATYVKEGDKRVLKLEIPRGCDGKAGENGRNGEGLEQGLVRIAALSWRHGGYNMRLADIELSDEETVSGIVIAFTEKVLADRVDANHIFQVLIPHQVTNQTEMPLTCRCALPGHVIPVEVMNYEDGVIIRAKKTVSPASAVAFIPMEKYSGYFNQVRELWVVLRGDFVIDTNGRAIDAAFVRAEPPINDQEVDRTYGIQGGVFESWFFVQRIRRSDIINVNTASLDELVALPRIGEVLARKIINGRLYHRLDDIVRVDGISDHLFADIRDRISID